MTPDNDDPSDLDWPATGARPAKPVDWPDADGTPPVEPEPAEYDRRFDGWPSWAGPIIAVLLSITLLFSLRLVALRHDSGSGARRADPSAPSPASGAAPPASRHALLAPPTETEVRAFVETWRTLWEARDAEAYLALYSDTFGAQGKTIDDWRAMKKKLFAAGDSIVVTITGLDVTVGPKVAIAQFRQDYRRGVYEDSGTKRLYIRRESAGLRIFNEEFVPSR